VSPSKAHPAQSHFDNIPILLLCVTIFLGFLTVAMPLPVIPILVRHDLGFSDWIVGLTVGIQFFVTVSTRKFAGSTADRVGGHVSVRRGLAACALAGATYQVAAWYPGGPLAKLAVLWLGRIALGFGESLMLTGLLSWGVALSGRARTGRVMSWVGMAVFSSLAVGAPLGLALSNSYGFRSVGLAVTLLPLLALAVTVFVPRARTLPGGTVSFRRVVRLIWRPGLALGLQGVGFAGIGAFVSLYFTAQNWSGAGLSLSAFGGAFILARLIFGNMPDRFGGAKVVLGFFVVEALGQAVMAGAASSATALAGAALTGFGCSMIFPCLGVETIRMTPPESRGSALGAFAAFQDIASGLTGPSTGFVAGLLGYRYVFVIGAVAALAGLIVALPLLKDSSAQPEPDSAQDCAPAAEAVPDCGSCR